MLRVTADTNVIVSALNFPGNPWRILDLAARGEIRLAVSSEILNEVNRVLLRQKFGWSQDRVDAAIRQIAAQKLTFPIGHDFRDCGKTHVSYKGTTSEAAAKLMFCIRARLQSCRNRPKNDGP